MDRFPSPTTLSTRGQPRRRRTMCVTMARLPISRNRRDSTRPPAGTAVATWTDVFGFDTAKYGSEGAPLHDPCVIAYLIGPALFHGRHINVEIETGSELTLGMTVADGWRVTKREPNAMFMGSVDREGFYRLLTEQLGRL